MSISPFTGVLFPKLSPTPSIDIVPDLMSPVPVPDDVDPTRFCQPLRVYFMHHEGPLHVDILVPSYYWEYSTICSIIKDRWHTADPDNYPLDSPLVLTDRLGTVLNVKNLWEFQSSKDICLAWYGDDSIQTLFELATKKRAMLSAHFHHLGVSTAVAHFAVKDGVAGGDEVYHNDNPWINRWEALYRREAEGSLGRAWGAQDPRSYLRELVGEDDQGQCDEATETAQEMDVLDIQEDEEPELETTEEYQTIKITISMGGRATVDEMYDVDDE